MVKNGLCSWLPFSWSGWSFVGDEGDEGDGGVSGDEGDESDGGVDGDGVSCSCLKLSGVSSLVEEK